eukprot:TRINITY_DN6721_c0_g3_i1.p1 TRINITY_DN6721_c0_g3~~TRINITY_DN6721_c0_g3_i1.p1  ORF type:complete len:557 (-),score=106.91 TRINITY_DN6721_c0_g3_i1:511-2181(-)
MLVQVGRRYVSEQRDIDPLFAKAMQDLLSRSKVFHGTHEEFIRDIIVSCNRKEFPPNRYLMEEGTKGDSMYVLFKGVVEVTANGRYICKLRDGSIVGEAALLNIDNRRTASVRSVQKCDVAIISRFSFHSILEKYPWEKRKFQQEMKNKLMELGKLIDLKEDINLEQQATQCDALKSIPFFANDESLHDFVAELAMNASAMWVRAGKILIQEGDTNCDDMYVLLKGSCEVYSCGHFLGRLENEIFGETGLLDLLEKRTASVITATPCMCMRFTRQVVIPVLAKYPDARLRLLDHARQRLVALSEVIAADEALQKTHLQDSEVYLATAAGRRPGCALGFGPSVDPADANLFATNEILKEMPVEMARKLSERMASKRFSEGQVIFQEGDPFSKNHDFVYFIVKGEVEVWKSGNFVSVYKPGDVFGELAAFRDWHVQQATVKAKTKVVELRAILARSLLEVTDEFADQDLMEYWNEEVMSRSEQLMKKNKLADRLKLKTTDIDFMFMKLPGLNQNGKLKPKNTNMIKATENLEVMEWKPTGLHPVAKKKALPALPLTAR